MAAKVPDLIREVPRILHSEHLWSRCEKQGKVAKEIHNVVLTRPSRERQLLPSKPARERGLPVRDNAHTGPSVSQVLGDRLACVHG